VNSPAAALASGAKLGLERTKSRVPLAGLNAMERKRSKPVNDPLEKILFGESFLKSDMRSSAHRIQLSSAGAQLRFQRGSVHGELFLIIFLVRRRRPNALHLERSADF